MFPTIRGMDERPQSRRSRDRDPLSEPPAQRCSSLVFLLEALVKAPPLPDWNAAQWVAVLGAPQASPRVSAAAARRGQLGAAVIERPEVAGLLAWARTMWPGSVPAMAGALAGAARVQRSQPVDLGDATRDILEEIRRARSRRVRPARAPSRLKLVDPAELRAVEPPPAPTAAPDRIGGALEWMLAFVAPDVALPTETRLDIEASISVFLGWYVDVLASRPAGPELTPIPPSRTLIPKQRLSARLADREMIALLAGPSGSRRCPAERSWQQGMGYWTIVLLLSRARGVEPPEPSTGARQWWSWRLRSLAARPKSQRGGVAVEAGVPERRRPAM
jgi:hypothetical protein